MIVAGPGRIPERASTASSTSSRPMLTPRRRFRHDARGADAPLRPAGARSTATPRRAKRQMDQMARPRADRRRAGPGRGRAPGARRCRASTTCAIAGVAKGADREAGREHFYRRGKRALPARSANRRCSITSSGCATRRTALPSARTAQSAPRRSAPIRWTRFGGIGAARKKALLAHFGSAKAVAAASLVDLESVTGVSHSMAKRIHDFFHGA